MRIRLIVGSSFALCAVAAVTPSSAANIEAGVLKCHVHGSQGFIVGSSKDLDCEFKGLSGQTEPYYGEIDEFGLDVGYAVHAVLAWTVLAPSADVGRGVLAGTYGGVSAEVTVGLGVGANVLVGGSHNTIALQPVSVQAQEGMNIAIGVVQMKLRANR